MLNKFKKLNYFIGIITYNCMVGIVAKQTNLYKYTKNRKSYSYFVPF
jgi:hypothetical protein